MNLSQPNFETASSTVLRAPRSKPLRGLIGFAIAATFAGNAAAQDSVVARANPAPTVVQHFRPHDTRGINMFEAPKEDGVPYTGFQLQWGAAFAQEFQALHHRNNAAPNIVNATDTNKLIGIGAGFNNANANLFMDAQLARGARVELTSYLSTRHHNETWVKDGYLLLDGSPWENATLDRLMEYVTLRLGHFEINYGDSHFRRSDGGNTMFNPFVGNLIMDAFTTEIGAEIYVRSQGLMGMVGATGGEIRGTVLNRNSRAPSYLGKLGFDRELSPNTRVRLTGSLYVTQKSISNTLYSGSRAGSRYYFVLENTAATETSPAWSGDLQPGLRSKVHAWVVNPFVKYRGLELFGNFEQATGRAAAETKDRKWNQYAGDVVYRFCDTRLYVAGRYNFVRGRLANTTDDVRIERVQAGAGWFLTPNLEMKGEYVRQIDRGFPLTDIRAGGRFEGTMFEAVVEF